jgi:2',3'-cyclic-nucleotide 2'-phosphodiesterase (5'-nucleotidase family)
MIDVMNLLDGDASRFDERMFVTFGNHEFDKGDLDDAPMLDARIEESAFHWLGSNVEFVTGADGLPVIRAHNLGRTALRTAGGVKVGIFSLTTGVAQPEYVAGFDPLLATARAETRALREAGAEVVIALTHLEAQQDVDLLRTLCEPLDGGGTDPGCPDLLIGGHDHDAQALEVEDRWVLKADADAVSATVVEITLPGDGGPPRVEHRLEQLGAGVAPDPAVAAVAASWGRRHDHLFCSGIDAPDGCLAEPLGRTRVRLTAEELAIRRYETNLGDWVADLMLTAFDEADERRATPPRGRYLEAPPSQPARKAQQRTNDRPLVAFINSGSLRLNQDLPPGVVTRQDVEELFAYPTPLVLLEIDGRTLRQVANRAVEGWTGNGWWLQIAGWAFRHDPQAGTATDLTLLTADGPRPLRDSDRLLAVTGRYLVDPKIGDQDGYTMLSPQQILVQRGDLKQIVIEALRKAGDAGIAPPVEGRICNPQKADACLAVAP